MSSLVFLAIGDWGGQDAAPYSTQTEVENAAGIGSLASSSNVSFVMLLGDNFYENGIRGDDHNARFGETFEAVFAAPSLATMPFYAILGNHDYRGNVTAQVAYTDLSSRWRFPSLYYNFTAPVPGLAAPAHFFMLDTIIWSGDSYRDPNGTFVPAPGPADVAAAGAQIEWLKAGLAAARAEGAPYIFVAGHYPIYSACSHGPTAVLVSQLKPILLQYGVTAYLAGHDHCLNHIDDSTGIPMWLIGAGKDCCYDLDHVGSIPANSLKYHLASDNQGNLDGGFGSVEVTASGATVRYHATDGTVLYTAQPVRPHQ